MDYFCEKASSQMFNRVLNIPLLIVVLLVLIVSIVLIVFCKFYQKTISFKKIDRDKGKTSTRRKSSQMGRREQKQDQEFVKKLSLGGNSIPSSLKSIKNELIWDIYEHLPENSMASLFYVVYYEKTIKKCFCCF